MPSNKPVDLDVLIESALCPEDTPPPPPDMHRRIMRRVAIAARIDQERRQFRARLTMSGLVAAGAVGAALLSSSLLQQTGWFNWSVPGGMGMLDHLALSLAGPDLLSWAISGALLTVLAVAAGTLSVARVVATRSND